MYYLLLMGPNQYITLLRRKRLRFYQQTEEISAPRLKTVSNKVATRYKS